LRDEQRSGSDSNRSVLIGGVYSRLLMLVNQIERKLEYLQDPTTQFELSSEARYAITDMLNTNSRSLN